MSTPGKPTKSATTSASSADGVRRTSASSRPSRLRAAILSLLIAWRKRRERQLEQELARRDDRYAALDPDDQRELIRLGFFPGRKAA